MIHISVIKQFVNIFAERRKVNGEWSDHTNWVPVTMFGSRAESLSKYLHKGSKVGVTGKLSYQQWKDKEGNNRSKLEVVADDLELLSPKSSGGESNIEPEIDASTSIYDEDIPF